MKYICIICIPGSAMNEPFHASQIGMVLLFITFLQLMISLEPMASINKSHHPKFT